MTSTKKFKYYIDLLDGTITTGKVHSFYKGFYTKKDALNYRKNIDFKFPYTNL